MKHLQSRPTYLRAGLLTLVLLLGGVSPAAAQVQVITVTADENGNGTFMTPTGINTPLPFIVGQDTGPGGRPNALIYGLFGPPFLTAGDVFVPEPGGQLGDLIRFNPNQLAPGGGTGVLVFYSLPIGTDLADLAGFPTANYANTATAVENAAGIITYTPTAGQPGFMTALNPVTYSLTSPDPVGAPIPEPSTLSILGIGLGIAAWWRKRRAAMAA